MSQKDPKPKMSLQSESTSTQAQALPRCHNRDPRLKRRRQPLLVPMLVAALNPLQSSSWINRPVALVFSVYVMLRVEYS